MVTVPVLKQAALIATDAPTSPIRQDEGIVPKFKFFRIYAINCPFSFDHEQAVAQAYAYLGQGLSPLFESKVHELFGGSTAQIVTVAPKSFQRMHNKLLNPAEHGDDKIPRPRCAKNVDVMRGCIIVDTAEELKEAYDKLKGAFKVVRVKNTHDPSTDGYGGGYRSLLVNFIFDSGVKWAQLFGDKVNFDFSDTLELFMKQAETHLKDNETHLGHLWLDHAKREPGLRNLLALQGLQVIASEQPDESVKMIAELQIVLKPYFEGRAVSHLLFKVGRCDTGAMEMVRDFYQEYFHKEALKDARLLAVRDIAVAVKEGREVPKRVTDSSYEATDSQKFWKGQSGGALENSKS